MSDKHLTELEWKKFAKGKKYEDKDFVKAIAALETAAHAKDATAELKALDDIAKQATKLRTANKADKDLLRYLDDAEREATSRRKLAEMDARKAAKPAPVAEQDGDDEDGPAALTTRMVPLLRQVARGEAALQAVVAVLGKEAAVLVSNRAVGASQRKLLQTELGATSGVKFMPGTCVWEANAHTFVLEAKVANLAKLVRAALFKQTGLRLKVRLRGADPDDVDDDGEPAHDAAVDGAGAPPAAPAPTAPPASAASTTSSAAPARAAFNARLAALLPSVKAAIAAAGPQAAEIRRLVADAGAHAAKNEYTEANAGLDAAERLLATTATGSAGATDATAATAAAAPSVTFTKTRLAWDATRKLVQQQLQQLETAMVAAYQGDADLDDLVKGTVHLYSVLDTLDERLIDKLDEALNASTAADARARQNEALAIIGDYQRFVDTDALMGDIDDNGFVDLTIASTVKQRLADMAVALR